MSQETTPDSPGAIRERLGRIAEEVKDLTARARDGVIDEAEFAREIRRLGVERDRLQEMLPPPSPPGARIVTAIGAFCEAYLGYREVR